MGGKGKGGSLRELFRLKDELEKQKDFLKALDRQEKQERKDFVDIYGPLKVFHFSDVQLRRNAVNIFQNIELEFKIKFKNYLDGMREFMNTTSLSNATLV